ncbi:MAG: hypothetical protein GKR92_02425 [Gammaproteobacteria bacterium]|nr:MAG: hypothetical protein GKR92_02425 [Gammaproteobacteria bacterium]
MSLALLLASFCLSAKTLNFTTSISIDAIEGSGIDLRDIKVNFDSLLESKSSYSIQIGSAVLPENRGTIKDIHLVCYEGEISKQVVACNEGVLSFKDPLASADKAKVQFLKNKEGDVSFTIDNFDLAGGSASLQADMQDDVWQARLKSNNISFSMLQEVLPEFPELFSKGSMKSDITFFGNGSSLNTIHGDAYVNKFSFSNEESTAVGEGVGAKIGFRSKRFQDIWQSEINATTFQGELYFDPVFIDANANPKDLYGRINWQVGSSKIELAPLHFEDANVVHLAITTIIDIEKKQAITPVQADIQYALFPKVYDEYMQPFLLDSNMADLTTKGRLAGSILLDSGRIVETNLDLNYLTFEDNQNRFSISKLNGKFGWGKRYSGKDYEFNFETASIYKMQLESSKFSFSNDEQALVLQQPVSVPILDGAVNIESFKVMHPGNKDQSILMDISVTPVSMSKISTAFGWPEMKGNLSGYAPNVTYKQGDVDIQGALLIRGFGGTTTIHNLSAADLFSLTPKLSADVQLNNLDLISLTETFSFGEITGRLEGSINNMQFVSWAPVQFDAWFGTPETDNSRHRISQTAVDNLTQVGNGGADILSKSFLKFFDSFGYDKLGLGCSLKNNICKMHGVNSFTQDNSRGFYIVKGRGVPRIDIVGFTDEVSWPVLIARLKRVVSTQEVIVN